MEEGKYMYIYEPSGVTLVRQEITDLIVMSQTFSLFHMSSSLLLHCKQLGEGKSPLSCSTHFSVAM